MSLRHPCCSGRSSGSSGSGITHRDSTSMAARSQAANSVRRSGGSNQASTAAYVSGNVHATENAKAVGNL
jgi:hypothetical protein